MMRCQCIEQTCSTISKKTSFFLYLMLSFRQPTAPVTCSTRRSVQPMSGQYAGVRCTTASAHIMHTCHLSIHLSTTATPCKLFHRLRTALGTRTTPFLMQKREQTRLVKQTAVTTISADSLTQKKSNEVFITSDYCAYAELRSAPG